MKMVSVSMLLTLFGSLLVDVTQAEESQVAARMLEPIRCGEIARLHTFEGICLGSQPQPLDFDKLAAAGIKTVVSLRYEREVDWDEEEVAMEAGLTFFNVPFRQSETLTDAVFAEMRALLTDVRTQPMLVHCSTGNRVGAIWLAHRVLDCGLDFEAALAEAHTVGLTSPAFIECVLAYIQRSS